MNENPPMNIAQQVMAHLPYLRRYARALSGSQKAGDAYVVAVLEALLENREIVDAAMSPRAALYKAFTRIWSSVSVNADDHPALSALAEHHLSALTPRSRQAFLLCAMERFDEREAATILDLTLPDLRELLEQAGREISAQVATDVLIIEDEPLIAMDLEAIMEDLGHRIVGIARTHKEALEIVRDRHVGLILADIQLADGSSGIDAVNDLLESFSVPVIFITAFPERLLTSMRAEPTYLITKPFQASLVAALSSQALFFGENARKGR